MQPAFPMATGRRLSLALVTATLLTSGAPALAEQPSDERCRTMIFDGVGMPIDADARIDFITVPVDRGISHIFDVLDVGGMAAFQIENSTQSLATGVTWWIGSNPSPGQGTC